MGDKESFDVGALISDLDKEFEEVAVPETQGDEEQTEVVEKQEPQVEEVEETPQEEPQEDEELEELEEKPTQDVDVNDPDIHKRNEAFKKLREEKQKLEESDKLLAELAEQYGISKEELITKFKEDKIKKQAEQQGMSVEQYKRLQTLESEVSTIREQYQREAFNFEAERLVRKFNLTEKEVEGVILQISAMGIDLLSNPKLIEPMYKALNYETAVEKGRQAQLAETKKRRESAASPTLGTKGTNVDTSETDMDGEIDAFLQEKLGFK
jgi:myosin heavy subunit